MSKAASEEMSTAPASGFHRLWSDNEAYFVTVTAGRVQFRGRDFSCSVEECLANGDRFEPVISLEEGNAVHEYTRTR